MYTNTGLTEEARNISNKQHNFPPKGGRKRTPTKQNQQKEENNII